MAFYKNLFVIVAAQMKTRISGTWPEALKFHHFYFLHLRDGDGFIRFIIVMDTNSLAGGANLLFAVFVNFYNDIIDVKTALANARRADITKYLVV